MNKNLMEKWAKYVSRNFMKKDTKMAFKFIKRC